MQMRANALVALVADTWIFWATPCDFLAIVTGSKYQGRSCKIVDSKKRELGTERKQQSRWAQSEWSWSHTMDTNTSYRQKRDHSHVHWVMYMFRGGQICLKHTDFVHSLLVRPYS